MPATQVADFLEESSARCDIHVRPMPLAAREQHQIQCAAAIGAPSPVVQEACERAPPRVTVGPGAGGGLIAAHQ